MVNLWEFVVFGLLLFNHEVISTTTLPPTNLPSKSAPLINCRFPGSPAHATVDFSDDTLSPGTIATYTCERGFELLGPARRVCEPDGRWLPDGIPFCVLNVAAGKAPMQASTEAGGIPQRAIDGSTSSFFSADTCTLTKPEKTPWWYVNLLEPYMVQLVRLDFGKSCCGAGKPATIVVRVGNNRPDLGTNPICNRFTGFLEEGQPLFLPCNPPMPGAFVSVHLEVPVPTQLSICEAFVYTDQALPIERCPQFRDQPPGSTATYNGKCYIFYNRQPIPFRDALAFCRARGGTLVDESNPALQGFISWELWRRHRSDTNSQYWMGAVRDPQERTNWKWINGEDVTVSFWNLPAGEEDCARYDGSKGWLWSDTNCNTNLNYICQHQPKACGRPEQPPNSTMAAQNFNVGAQIEYACDDGHLLVGPSIRTCLETGFYNEFPPVCKHIQCGYPANIINGGYTLINDSVGYLSTVVYHCDPGYEMLGRAQLTCDIDERWNGPPPRCEPIQCEQPPRIQHGTYQSTNNVSIFGTIVEYECVKGFKLIGPKEIKCLENGLFDQNPPICQEDSSTSAASPTITITSPRTTKAPSTTRKQRPTRPVPTTVKALTESEIFNKVKQNSNPPRTRKPPTTNKDNNEGESAHVPHIIVASHPQENEVGSGSNVNVRHGETPDVNLNVPLPVDGEREHRKEPFGAKLNLGAVIALGAFGGFVFLAAIITTIVILVRRNQSAKHYRHRASPDCNTVASFDSSSSESRNGGLNRYYRQAWENLHESAGSKAGLKASAAVAANHSPLRRKETMDEPYRNGERHRDGSEMVVTDTAAYKGVGGGGVATGAGGGEKKRHHHHHHHHDTRAHKGEWRERESSRHNHKRY